MPLRRPQKIDNGIDNGPSPASQAYCNVRRGCARGGTGSACQNAPAVTVHCMVVLLEPGVLVEVELPMAA